MKHIYVRARKKIQQQQQQQQQPEEMIERMSRRKFEALEVIFFAGQRKHPSHPRRRVVNVQLLSQTTLFVKMFIITNEQMGKTASM